MNKVINFLSSTFNDINLFKTPLLTRKQYVFSILKVFLLYAFLFGLAAFFWYIISHSIPSKIFFAGIIEIILIAIASYFIFIFIIYFNILFIKRYLDTSMPLWLLFIVPIMYIFSCSLSRLDDITTSKSEIVYYIINVVWILPAILLLILSFFMPSSHKERSVITKIKNSLYIKKNILYPINNILTYNFISRINNKQFLYGIVFIFAPIFLFIFLKYIVIFLGEIYSDIFNFNIIKMHTLYTQDIKINVVPLIPQASRIGSIFFIFFSFSILFSNTYTYIKKYKSFSHIIGLTILFMLPFSIFQFYGYVLYTYSDFFNIVYKGILPYEPRLNHIGLLLISIILLNIYYLIVYRNNRKIYKVQNTTNISFKEYFYRIIIVVFLFFIVMEVLNYCNYDFRDYMTTFFKDLIDVFLSFDTTRLHTFKDNFHILSIIKGIGDDILFLWDIVLFFYILYYTTKRINHAVINKFIFIPPLIMYILKDYSNETYFYIGSILFIILLIVMAKYLPDFLGERKYIFNNEKYKRVADFFNISSQIENILFFKLKSKVSIREFILSLIFVFALYIIIYIIVEHSLSDINFITFYVIYPVFVLLCNAIYTIYMKSRGSI